MSAKKHSTGGFRAYKQIDRVVHQLYFANEKEAENMQADLEKRSRAVKSLKGRSMFNLDGRFFYLRVRAYKKTNRPTFQLQTPCDGKQDKIQRFFKASFEVTWTEFFALWCKHFNLSVVDVISYKEEIKTAKRLYMQDVYAIENAKDVMPI